MRLLVLASLGLVLASCARPAPEKFLLTDSPVPLGAKLLKRSGAVSNEKLDTEYQERWAVPEDRFQAFTEEAGTILKAHGWIQAANFETNRVFYFCPTAAVPFNRKVEVVTAPLDGEKIQVIYHSSDNPPEWKNQQCDALTGR